MIEHFRNEKSENKLCDINRIILAFIAFLNPNLVLIRFHVEPTLIFK